MAGETFTIGKPSRDKWLKMLVYGPYGSGKTFFAGTAADVSGMRDVIFIDAEAGSMTLADMAASVDTVEVKSFAEVARVFEFLSLHCRLRDAGKKDDLIKLEAKLRGVEPKTIKAPKMYNTVVIDSLSEVQKYCLYQILGVQIGTDALDEELADPGFQGYGKLSEMTRLLVRSFRSLPMHVIFVAAAQEVQDETKRNNHIPLLMGKSGVEVQGLVDVVGFLWAAVPRDPEAPILRRLFLQPSTLYKAKDRYHAGNAIAYVEAPTLKTFLSQKSK